MLFALVSLATPGPAQLSEPDPSSELFAAIREVELLTAEVSRARTEDNINFVAGALEDLLSLSEGQPDPRTLATVVPAVYQLALSPAALEGGRDRFLDLALRSFDRATEYGDQQSIGNLSSWMLESLKSTARWTTALDVIDRAIAAIDDPWNEANLLVHRADIDRRLGDWSSTAATVARTESLLKQLTPTQPAHNYVLAGLHGLIAQYQTDLGLFDLAASSLDRERDIAARSPDLSGRATIRRLDFYLATEQWERMAAAAETFLSSSGQRPGRVLDAEHALGCALAQLALSAEADPVRAVETLENCLASPELDPVRRVFALLNIAELEINGPSPNPASAAKRLDSAESVLDQIAVLSDKPAISEATYLHALRTRLPNGVLPQPRAELAEQFERSFQALTETWAATPVRPGGVGFLNLDYRRALILDLIRLDLESESGGVERALERLFELQTLGTLARRLELSAPGLDTVRQSLLGARSGLLLYLPARSATLLFALDADSADVFELPGENELRELQDQFGPALEAASERGVGVLTPDSERAAAQLARQLLPPEVRQRIAAWECVFIVGRSELGGVHFEALPYTEEHALGEAAALAHLPSVPVGVYLAERAATRPAGATFELSLATTSIHGPTVRSRFPQLEPVPLDKADVAQLLEPFASARELQDCTLEDLRSTSSDRILHVLTHGGFLPERERPAALHLAPGDGSSDSPNGLVSGDEIESSRVPGVVILSACGTARGPRRLGDDGLANLGGAFLAAGAHTVVLARAEIELGATLSLMQRLHEELASGTPTAEAMRRARAALPTSGATRHLLEVLGHGAYAPIARPARRAWTPATLAGALGLVGLLVLVGRRIRSTRRARATG